MPTVLVFQLEVYYKVDRLLTGPTAQQKGTAARWYSNKTSLCSFILSCLILKDISCAERLIDLLLEICLSCLRIQKIICYFIIVQN